MYNSVHSTSFSFIKWPTATFTLGPHGTFVPINTTYGRN